MELKNPFITGRGAHLVDASRCETDICLLGGASGMLMFKRLNCLVQKTAHDHNFLMHGNQIPFLGTDKTCPFKGAFRVDACFSIFQFGGISIFGFLEGLNES